MSLTACLSGKAPAVSIPQCPVPSILTSHSGLASVSLGAVLAGLLGSDLLTLQNQNLRFRRMRINAFMLVPCVPHCLHFIRFLCNSLSFYWKPSSAERALVTVFRSHAGWSEDICPLPMPDLLGLSSPSAFDMWFSACRCTRHLEHM